MSLDFNCPQCGVTLHAQDNMAGRDIRCGSCQAVFMVPEAAAEPERRPGAEPRRIEREMDSSEDEPRPRRRAVRYDENDYEPRRPRRGRGPLFWIMMTIGIMFLGCCACCGGVYFMLPSENWQRHESTEGGFAVDLPAPVQKNMKLPGLDLEPGQKVEGTILWKRGEFFAVMYMTLQRPGMPDEILDSVMDEMRADPESRVVRVDRITISGLPAREIEYIYEDGGTYMGRAVVANGRLLIAVSGGRFVRPGNANARRFLDSFTITQPGKK